MQQQVQTQDLLKFLGKDHIGLVLSWLDTTLKQQQLAYNNASINLEGEQGKVQMLTKLILDISSCASKSH